MFSISIPPVSNRHADALRHKIDTKTKPLGALGQLEDLALKIGCIQSTLNPVLRNPTIVVFAGDHGIAAEGVSAYPQEVTFQMVLNFLAGGAAINVFSRQHGIALHVVDAGVNFDFKDHPQLIKAKIGHGTRSYLQEPAMTLDQCRQALARGSEIVDEIHQSGSNVIGFGEMGIGNTSSASILMSLLCGIELEHCIGRGTGLDSTGLKHKIQLLTQAVEHHVWDGTPLSALTVFGGFEIAMMCGAFLKAAELKMLLLVDGFIATSAVLVASKFHPHVLEYCCFSHQSDESGHQRLLEYLKAEPLLRLNMRLGEGTGAAMAYPLVQASVNFLNEMASFESAGVSDKDA